MTVFAIYIIIVIYKEIYLTLDASGILHVADMEGSAPIGVARSRAGKIGQYLGYGLPEQTSALRITSNYPSLRLTALAVSLPLRSTKRL